MSSSSSTENSMPEKFLEYKRLLIMANVIGLLKIRVIKGINLVVKDANSSDPYVIVSMGSQVFSIFLISVCN